MILLPSGMMEAKTGETTKESTMMDGTLQPKLFQAEPAVIGLVEVETTDTVAAMTVVVATMGEVVVAMEEVVVMVEAAVEMVVEEAETESTSMTSQSLFN